MAEQGKKRKAEEAESTAQRNDEGDWFVDLGKNKRLTVRKFKAMVLVDIREHYEKNGQMLPGKKGLSLSPEQFAALLEQSAGATAEIEKLGKK
mmetsp:Transcript_26925/g.59607  ORF Transcript_26925/g.59607 Transcript_26925/m.59607 type:complete len:93 (+) Transcript_26925:32-310(+)